MPHILSTPPFSIADKVELTADQYPPQVYTICAIAFDFERDDWTFTLATERDLKARQTPGKTATPQDIRKV